MSKPTLSDIIAALALLASLLTAFVAAKVAYDVWAAGSIPPKQIETQSYGLQKPFEQLSEQKGDINVQIRSGKEVISKLWSVQTSLKNDGRAPILPSDIFEPISINVNAPWQIVAISGNSLTAESDPTATWTKISDRSFSMKPSLLNPGDLIWSNIYLTVDDSVEVANDAEPQITWKGRIANLRAFKKGKTFTEEYAQSGPPIAVSIDGWGVVFLVIAFLTNASLFYNLLVSRGLLNSSALYSTVLISVTLAISLAAADGLTTYLMPGQWTKISGVNHFMNMPPIIASILAATWLYRRPVINS